VKHAASQLLLIAPPGCGKTEVLAMRAEYLVNEGLVRPNRRLLAITYSKRARDNMAQRIQNRLGYQRTKRFVTIQNFHGLAGRIVRAHGTTLGIPHDVEFPTRRWLASTMSKHTGDWDLKKETDRLLRTLKSSAINDAHLHRLVVESKNDLAIEVEIERLKQNRLDYPDLLRHAQRLLLIPEISELYQQHFDALVVDEFQDLSTQQLDIVSRVCARNAIYVGDPLQGIYSWAGAEPETVLKSLTSRCSERIDLDISYRSSPQVLTMVNAASSDLGAPPLSAADPNAWVSPAGHALAFDFVDDSAEAAAITRVVTHINKEYPQESIGIITRSGFRRKLIDQELATVENLPLQVWDMALDTPGLLPILRRAAQGIRRTPRIGDQLSMLRKRAVELIGDDDVDTMNEMDDALQLLAERANSGDSIRDMLARFKEVSVSEEVGPGIHLLNAHIGKGQQFDWAIVIGLEEGHVPDFRSLSAQDYEEEERVLMVMLSRAKRGLIVTRVGSVTTQYGTKKPKKSSRWWTALEAVSESPSSAMLHVVNGTR